MSTPIKPVSTETQRRQPTVSPSSGMERAVIRAGVTNAMAVASATPRRPRPSRKKLAEPSSINPRRICRPGWAARNTVRPPRAANSTATVVSVRYRSHVISSEGKVRLRCLAATSEIEKRVTPATIRAMARLAEAGPVTPTSGRTGLMRVRRAAPAEPFRRDGPRAASVAPGSRAGRPRWPPTQPAGPPCAATRSPRRRHWVAGRESP